MSKVTKQQQIVDFIKAGGIEGRRASEIQKFICELNGHNWDEMVKERDWHNGGYRFRRRFRGYYCTNLYGCGGMFSQHRPGIFEKFNIVKNDNGRWVHPDCIESVKSSPDVKTEDLPQYIEIDNDGNKYYYKDKEMKILHREDGPAIEYADGYKEWWRDGELHRENGPAIEYSNGTKFWYRDGKKHRVDGPAIEWESGTKFWYRDDKLHREDGPAIEFAHGTKEWYINGERLYKAEFLSRTQPVKEMTIAEIEKLLGHKVKVIAG
jgi:hypothetical protein